MSYLSHSEVKTRKPRRCWGCVEVFPPGTQMTRVVSKDGGDLVTTYTCLPCQQYIDEACKRDPYLAGDGIDYGYVRECRQHDALAAAAVRGEVKE